MFNNNNNNNDGGEKENHDYKRGRIFKICNHF